MKKLALVLLVFSTLTPHLCFSDLSSPELTNFYHEIEIKSQTASSELPQYIQDFYRYFGDQLAFTEDDREAFFQLFFSTGKKYEEMFIHSLSDPSQSFRLMQEIVSELRFAYLNYQYAYQMKKTPELLIALKNLELDLESFESREALDLIEMIDSGVEPRAMTQDREKLLTWMQEHRAPGLELLKAYAYLKVAQIEERSRTKKQLGYLYSQANHFFRMTSNGARFAEIIAQTNMKATAYSNPDLPPRRSRVRR